MRGSKRGSFSARTAIDGDSMVVSSTGIAFAPYKIDSTDMCAVGDERLRAQL